MNGAASSALACATSAEASVIAGTVSAIARIERAVRQLGARIGAQPVEGGGMSSARPFSAGLDCACPLTSRTPAFFAGRSIALFASAR